jgi:hypothetical protein
MVENGVKQDPFDPSEDMKYEMSLLDYKGETNKGVECTNYGDSVNLHSFVLNGLTFHVKDRMSYEPWNYGRVNKGSGQLGVYKLETSWGKTYFAVIKDYIAFEGDWRIVLVNIRESEWDLRSWLQMSKAYGFTLADYAFGRFNSGDIGK